MLDIIIFTDETVDDDRQFIVPFSDILRDTVHVEGNNVRVVSFSTKIAHDADYNIKFRTERDARYYVEENVKRYLKLELLIYKNMSVLSFMIS